MTLDPQDLIEHRVTTTYYAEKAMNPDKPNRRIFAGALVALFVGVVISSPWVKYPPDIVEMLREVVKWVVIIYIGARAVEKLPKLSEIVKGKEVKE